MSGSASGKPKPFTFRPPKTSPFFIRQAKRILPLVLRRVLKTVEIEIPDADLERLRELKGERVLLAPSHSGGLEPYILFHLSRLLEEEYNFLATKEVFEGKPVRGWFAQKLGVYSIVRGTADRPSFQTTRRLLAEGKRPLVIFPEGYTCWQNDTVMPFQQGVAQFAFWALEDLDKQGEHPPLWFVPMAVKYVYLRDMRGEIDRALGRLERKLFSNDDLPPAPLYERLRRVGEVVLKANEKEYNIRPAPDAAMNDRVQRLKEEVVSRVATALGLPNRPELPLLDRVRDLFNAVDRIAWNETDGGEYERQLRRTRQEKAMGLYDDLWRVQRFVALYDGYVRETLSAERFLDVVKLLEMEIFDRKNVRGPRKAVVRVGEPINLQKHFPRYRENKRAALREVTAALENSVRELLEGMSGLTRPVESPS